MRVGHCACFLLPTKPINYSHSQVGSPSLWSTPASDQQYTHLTLPVSHICPDAASRKASLFSAVTVYTMRYKLNKRKEPERRTTKPTLYLLSLPPNSWLFLPSHHSVLPTAVGTLDRCVKYLNRDKSRTIRYGAIFKRQHGYFI